MSEQSQTRHVFDVETHKYTRTLTHSLTYPHTTHAYTVKTLGLDFFYKRKEELHVARNAENVDKKKMEIEKQKQRDRMRSAAVRREMGFWRYYCCFSQRNAVLAKILPDLEPPPKKITKKASSKEGKKKKRSATGRGRRKINVRTKDDKYLEKSEKRREERRRSREAMGRTRISKRNKVSTKVLKSKPPSKQNNKRPSSRRGKKISTRKTSRKKQKRQIRGPTSRVR